MNINRAMLPERFAYLFEDIEREIGPILDSDRVILMLRDKLANYEVSMKECEERDSKYLEKLPDAELLVEGLRVQLKEAEKALRAVQGRVLSEKANRLSLQRWMRVASMKLAQREKNIMLIEARKRLAAVGRAIKLNTGRYKSGGGFDIIRIDGRAVDVNDRPEVEPNEPTPEQVVKTHQYLYYVLGSPIWSDYEYDMYCKRHGIDGVGGSDLATDYDDATITLAIAMARDPSKFSSQPPEQRPPTGGVEPVMPPVEP